MSFTYKTRGAAERAVTMKARSIDSAWHSIIRLQDDGRWSAHIGHGTRGCTICRWS